MPVEAGELRRLLQIFNDRSGALGSAVITRSGVPLAWSLPEGAQVDNFGTMAATLLGALEVIYAGMKRDSPDEVVVSSSSGVLVARAITPKAFLVALAERDAAEFRKGLADLATRAKVHLGTVD